MATYRLTVTNDWSAGARITAAEDIDVLLTENWGAEVYFAITVDDTIPSMAVWQGHILSRYGAKEQRSMQLKTGERLWLAAKGTTVDLTVTEGVS